MTLKRFFKTLLIALISFLCGAILTCFIQNRRYNKELKLVERQEAVIEYMIILMESYNRQCDQMVNLNEKVGMAKPQERGEE